MQAGVRARQEKVPFATCEDEGTVDAEVKPLVGESFHSQNIPAEVVSHSKHSSTCKRLQIPLYGFPPVILQLLEFDRGMTNGMPGLVIV